MRHCLLVTSLNESSLHPRMGQCLLATFANGASCLLHPWSHCLRVRFVIFAVPPQTARDVCVRVRRPKTGLRGAGDRPPSAGDRPPGADDWTPGAGDRPTCRRCRRRRRRRRCRCFAGKCVSCASSRRCRARGGVRTARAPGKPP